MLNIWIAYYKSVWLFKLIKQYWKKIASNFKFIHMFITTIKVVWNKIQSYILFPFINHKMLLLYIIVVSFILWCFKWRHRMKCNFLKLFYFLRSNLRNATKMFKLQYFSFLALFNGKLYKKNLKIYR